MKIILLEDCEQLGRQGDIITVTDGFGRNYLLPRHKAIPLTKTNLSVIEEKKKQFEAKRAKEQQAAVALRDRLAKLTCRIPVQAGEGERLYGSVTSQDIQQALAQQGITIDKRKIEIAESIKQLGAHVVKLKLYPNVEASLSVEVIKQTTT